MVTSKQAQDYIDAGLALCAIEPHSKKPKGYDWQNEPRDAGHWELSPEDNIGVIHAHSGTCTIDIDDEYSARIALEALGIDMDGMLADTDMVHINSGRAGRGKLIFRTPPNFPDACHRINWPLKEDASKHFCVIEFRAGFVQDVLPPSIHPDTGRPYEWQGDFRNIPMLPQSLQRVWFEWGAVKPSLDDACPWVEKVDERAPRKATLGYRPQNSDHGDVIGKFNRAYDVGDILERHNYKRAGRRWIAPNSSTGMAGVVRLPDTNPLRIYSFHGSDPLADEHAHDAFSVFTMLECNGDQIAAVAKAADLMQLPPPPVDAETQALAARILAGAGKRSAIAKTQQGSESQQSAKVTNLSAYTKEREPEQQKQYTAPTMGAIPIHELEQVAVWLRSQVHSVKPDAVMQTVLAFACAMTSRRYETKSEHPTTTFFGIADSSTAGLRVYRDKIYNLCSQLGERRMIRGTGITGAHTLYQCFIRYPRMFWATDEYGTMLLRTRRQTSGAIESALATVSELYTGNTMYIDPDTATAGKPRDIKECDIFAPCLTMLALMGDSHVSALATPAEYSRGTLQQMLLIPAGDEVAAHHSIEGDPNIKPAGVVELLHRLNKMPGIPGNQDNPTSPPPLTKVEWEREVGSVFKDARKRYNAILDTLERQPFRGMAYGYQQSAIRLASALGAWANPERPMITPGVAAWACAWCERCLVLILPRIEIASGSDEPDVQEMVMRTLIDKKVPMTCRDLRRSCRPFRSLKNSERDEILTLMVEDGMIIAEKHGKTTRYQPASKTN